jgi:hypothetical protein
MPDNEITVGLRLYTELLSVLVSENNIFLQGQPIWAIDDVTGSRKKGLKVGDYDPVTMLPGTGTPFIDLDWIIKPTSAGADGFTPFTIKTTDAGKYVDNLTDTIITDDRLLGVTTVLVSSTVNNVFFRPADKVIDPALGKLTLLGFTGMGAGDEILIFIPAAIVVSASLTALVARVAQLEIYAAPYMGEAGGKVPWGRSADTIPAGWREWVDMRGKFPMAQDPNDVVTPGTPYDAITNPSIKGFAKPVGTMAGAVNHVIGSMNNLPKHRFLTVVDEFASLHGHPSDFGRAITAIKSMLRYFFKNDLPPNGGSEGYELCGTADNNIEPTMSPTNYLGKDVPDAINHMNPYRIVLYIEPAI